MTEDGFLNHLVLLLNTAARRLEKLNEYSVATQAYQYADDVENRIANLGDIANWATGLGEEGVDVVEFVNRHRPVEELDIFELISEYQEEVPRPPAPRVRVPRSPVLIPAEQPAAQQIDEVDDAPPATADDSVATALDEQGGLEMELEDERPIDAVEAAEWMMGILAAIRRDDNFSHHHEWIEDVRESLNQSGYLDLEWLDSILPRLSRIAVRLPIDISTRLMTAYDVMLSEREQETGEIEADVEDELAGEAVIPMAGRRTQRFERVRTGAHTARTAIVGLSPRQRNIGLILLIVPMLACIAFFAVSALMNSNRSAPPLGAGGGIGDVNAPFGSGVPEAQPTDPGVEQPAPTESEVIPSPLGPADVSVAGTYVVPTQSLKYLSERYQQYGGEPMWGPEHGVMNPDGTYNLGEIRSTVRQYPEDRCGQTTSLGNPLDCNAMVIGTWHYPVGSVAEFSCDGVTWARATKVDNGPNLYLYTYQVVATRSALDAGNCTATTPTQDVVLRFVAGPLPDTGVNE